MAHFIPQLQDICAECIQHPIKPGECFDLELLLLLIAMLIFTCIHCTLSLYAHNTEYIHISEESVSCVLDAYKFLVMALNWSIRIKTVLEDLILIHLLVPHCQYGGMDVFPSFIASAVLVWALPHHLTYHDIDCKQITSMSAQANK